MIDEKTDQELKITASSFCDPYILLIRDDHSSIVLKLDRKGELDEVEGAEAFKSSKWKSACLHSPPGADHPLAYLLNTKGTLNVRAYESASLEWRTNVPLGLPTSGLEQAYLCHRLTQLAIDSNGEWSS